MTTHDLLRMEITLIATICVATVAALGTWVLEPVGRHWPRCAEVAAKRDAVLLIALVLVTLGMPTSVSGQSSKVIGVARSGTELQVVLSDRMEAWMNGVRERDVDALVSLSIVEMQSIVRRWLLDVDSRLHGLLLDEASWLRAVLLAPDARVVVLELAWSALVESPRYAMTCADRSNRDAWPGTVEGVYPVADGRETACVRWIQEGGPDGEWLLSYSFGYDSPEASREWDDAPTSVMRR